MGREQFHNVVRRYWELFTGGDIRYAASPYAIPAEHLPAWPTMRLRIDEKHNSSFRNAYELMATANGIRPSGPLTWRPP